MVGVSASVNLPLHHKVQKFSSGIGSPGWSRKEGRKTVVLVVVVVVVVVVVSQYRKAVKHSDNYTRITTTELHTHIRPIYIVYKSTQ